jgi:hypothetical protein
MVSPNTSPGLRAIQDNNLSGRKRFLFPQKHDPGIAKTALPSKRFDCIPDVSTRGDF